MNDEILMEGDRVFYTGERFKEKLHGKPGWLHASVTNQPGVWVVEFPGTRNSKDQKDTDDYVMSSKWLTKKNIAPDKKKDGPEIQPRRSRRSDDEVV
jgi:hypothetical protein